MNSKMFPADTHGQDAAVEEPAITFSEHSDPQDPGSSIAFFSAPSASIAITELRHRIMSFLGAPVLTPSERSDLELAIGEACTNALRHGSPHGELDHVLVKCIKGTDKLVVEVSDRGCGFDPEGVPQPSPEKLKGGGMGIFLMRSCVDRVEFEFGPGTTVRLVKYRRAN